MKKINKIVNRDKSGKFMKGRKGEINGGTFKKGHKGYLNHPNKTSFKKGKEHPAWKGGCSYEPYSVDWTKTLKRSIKERDHYTCQVCGEQEDLMIHHIDYNKKNSDPDNLVTLCRSCHTKTNYNRNNWVKYFYEKEI